jgi:cell wall-associated NlpC family hydrolase
LTPYRWGRFTDASIDFSVLVWAVFRRHGDTRPRDAGQQRAVGDAGERDELQPGDLLFSPGISLFHGFEWLFVHAHEPANEVTENSLE